MTCSVNGFPTAGPSVKQGQPCVTDEEEETDGILLYIGVSA
jgi:hypothetical protein